MTAILDSLILRKATTKDVPSIVSLLVEDNLGQLRECASPEGQVLNLL